MFCTNCGKEIDSNAKFCKYCGNDLHNQENGRQNNSNSAKKIGIRPLIIVAT